MRDTSTTAQLTVIDLSITSHHRRLLEARNDGDAALVEFWRD